MGETPFIAYELCLKICKRNTFPLEDSIRLGAYNLYWLN